MANTIFTEAEHDASFLKAYIKHLFGENIFVSTGTTIISTGGWTKLALVENEFIKTTDRGDTNIVIFDADSAANEGGYTVRREQLLEKATELNIQFELFLFPNNNEDGDFETLLEYLVCPKHKAVPLCFESYEACLRSKNTADFTYVTPSRKAKIFSYVEAITDPKEFEKAKKGQHYLYHSNEHWDLTNDYLIPLKNFLNPLLVTNVIPPQS